MTEKVPQARLSAYPYLSTLLIASRIIAVRLLNPSRLQAQTRATSSSLRTPQRGAVNGAPTLQALGASPFLPWFPKGLRVREAHRAPGQRSRKERRGRDVRLAEGSRDGVRALCAVHPGREAERV